MSKVKLTSRQQIGAWYRYDIEGKIAYNEREFSILFTKIMEIKRGNKVTLRQAYIRAYMEFMVIRYYIFT